MPIDNLIKQKKKKHNEQDVENEIVETMVDDDEEMKKA